MASLVEAAVLLVHAELRRIYGMLEVLVILERRLAVDDRVPRGATHGESVADDGPLWLV